MHTVRLLLQIWYAYSALLVQIWYAYSALLGKIWYAYVHYTRANMVC